MTVVVNAGEYVQVTVRLQNIGQQTGKFRLQAVIVPDGGTATAAVQTFYTASGYSGANPPPSGANIFETPPVTPNAEVTAIMYSNQWANGNPLTYSTQQIFDVIFQVTVVETGDVFQFRGENALQHQTLAPARPEVVGVDYIISAPTGYYSEYYQ